MSKLITSLYEYALYDDTQGVLVPTQQVPPTYPPALEVFRTGATATAGFGYGVQTVQSTTGATLPLVTQPGATLTFIGDPSNTSLLQIQQANRQLVPGGSATNGLYWYVGPNQTVTLPGALNGGTLTVQPVTVAYAASTAPYIVTVTWAV